MPLPPRVTANTINGFPQRYSRFCTYIGNEMDLHAKVMMMSSLKFLINFGYSGNKTAAHTSVISDKQ